IRECLDDVWAFVRSSSAITPHHNIVLYKGDPGAGPADIEVGVRVARPFSEVSPAGVHCSSLPAGRVVSAVHVGPYDQMGRTYDALLAFARDGGHEIRGPSWEIYGDWSDDPSKVETEICFVVEPG